MKHIEGRRRSLILAATLASYQPAQAAMALEQNRLVEVFEALGLIGTWSPDCQSPPSASNPRITYREFNGKVIHSVTFDGFRWAVIDEVGSAALIGRDKITLTVVRDQRIFATVTIQLRDGRLHILKSVGANGQVNVDREIETWTGRPALVDERCAAAIS
jgi:hypothetical protein